ncbi:hypothetical protein GIB67_018607 [Kingdonia uniflora]|uniref:Disease resistance R13L4/SHOC-2-like LRR domain-containing protein n=1 Tax=Kingdonia uniflora TaxID=39325 RepID=A0A7J7L8A6_9MAGN|nr:hypothetical protein GIB67_018607 [Kingdonia uniflora]
MAKEHQFLHVHKSNYNTSLDRGRACRLAVHQTVGFLSSSQAFIQHLRSYLHFDLCEGEMSQEIGGIFRTKQGCKWLRVLDLEGTYKPLLPKALGKLVHLRYLGVRRTWLDLLPSSFGYLFNLQTLDLKWTSIKSFPSSISRMENLRHLYFNWGECSTDLLHQPNHISFNNIQTLWGVLVPQGTSVANFDQCINLRKLGIEGDLMSHDKELTGWLSRLDRLESLKLCSTAGDLLPSELPSSSAVVEQSHALPALILFEKVHLVKLHLEGRLERLFIPRDFPPNLTTLTLVGSRLEDYSIKILDIYEGSMRNLKELEINKCEYLRDLPSGLQFLNHHEELRLPAMSDHLKERVLPNTGVDWYKITHIPFLRPSLNRWADMFPCMIARTSTAEVISGGVGGTKNGALQLKVEHINKLPVDLKALMNGLSFLILPVQKPMFSSHMLPLSDDPALAMAFSVARLAAAVPLLLVNGTYRTTIRKYCNLHEAFGSSPAYVPAELVISCQDNRRK